ncbi:TPA: DUF551 domain-containing protein [Klebsiella aerogenes]|nr:DUF551 domain-containing protein [Klebsiella aerogenes]
MTKSTITRERLQEIAEDGFLKHGESKELARMALAAMDSEPVASNYRKLFTCTGCGAEGLDEPLETACHCCVDGAHWVESRLYRHAQPAPVVPEEATPESIEILASIRPPHGFAFQWDADQRNAAADSWNACRGAMLQAGNSPVIPDTWIPVSERMPEKNQSVLISVNFDSSLVEPLICTARYTGSTFRRGGATIKPGSGIEQVTHWMPLPAAPQEVKGD